MATKAQRERDEAIVRLVNDYGLRPGDVVYTTNVHTSRSGMTRFLKVHLMRRNTPLNITGLVADATGSRFDSDRGAVKVEGCGMDMGFHLIYGLSRALFPDGHTCTGDRTCPSNDHSNDYSLSRRMARGEVLGDPFAIVETSAQQRKVDEVAERILREELGYRAGRKHTDGGYALTQRWM